MDVGDIKRGQIFFDGFNVLQYSVVPSLLDEYDYLLNLLTIKEDGSE